MDSDQRHAAKEIRQLLVDVSTLIRVDDGSGIQRVVRNILKCMLLSQREGIAVRPVCRFRGEYRYADDFDADCAVSTRKIDNGPVHIHRGDIFLGLDFDHRIDARALRFLQRQQREKGLQVYFVVYDLLAIFHPEWFPRHLARLIKIWLHGITATADGLICISNSVARELKQYIGNKRAAENVGIGFFHLGADDTFQTTPSSLTDEENLLVQWFGTKTVFLMVGTLEPRKGHQQVLDAMTRLWQGGEDVLLAIAGKKGWKVEHLVKNINNHAENGDHLFWFENVSDAFLQQLYTASSVLIMASAGEGFGLPLIEAAQYKLPLIVRDLPVFREVAGDNAVYFSGFSGHDLQQAISDWLMLYRQKKHPVSDGLQPQNWMQSAEQLLNVVLQQQWIE